jgi:hypothetical protein
MGKQSAQSMAEEVGFCNLRLQSALQWHLQANHYPPVSLVFIPLCIKAIEYANCKQWEKYIQLPNGKMVTVAKIVEGLHLEDFLKANEGQERRKKHEKS